MLEDLTVKVFQKVGQILKEKENMRHVLIKLEKQVSMSNISIIFVNNIPETIKQLSLRQYLKTTRCEFS